MVMFFYGNKAIGIDEAEFWEKSYLLRRTQYQKLDVAYTTDLQPLTDDKKDVTGRESISVSISAKRKDRNERDLQVCPLFIKDIAKSIISAGKSLQLSRRAPSACLAVFGDNQEIGQSIAAITLSEIFCVSVVALVGHGDHISKCFWEDERIVSLFHSSVGKQKPQVTGESLPGVACSEKIWYKLLADTFSRNREIDLTSMPKDASNFTDAKGENVATVVTTEVPLVRSFCPENPSMTVCQRSLCENKDAWSTLNLSRNFYLPPLNDEGLRRAIFSGDSGPFLVDKGTNYTFGFQFGEYEYARSQEDTKMLEGLFPFPTLLPSFQEDHHMSEFLPFQKNSTLPSRILSWIQSVELKATLLPVVILQECLIVYIKKQVDKIGGNILSKLLYDWRLMDELGVLRAIFLLGSGDLLQHFLTVVFNKLDKGESWDDDFELNMILQRQSDRLGRLIEARFVWALPGELGSFRPGESIRNSADSILLSAPDSLVVSISKNNSLCGDEQHDASILVSTPRKSRAQIFGIDGLESLKFTYKVSWPLELIANTEAIKKYNQVMSFLLKVKRAKFVLDKARRWMWKDRGIATISRKHHWLVEQKILHFVDAFHQYVMDRVYHSAWCELCEGMAAAGSLDEVIEVHEAYLLSIQRQCFVVPDKLWALIASRINSILGLALDFYSIQQTLSSGGAVSAIKARCEMEVDRIEKQFDDCIAFLLRVLSFKLNVGQFPHLADLVTRINYNYYYMSDNGNLKTVPGSETVTSKLGKAFPVRAD
ncbi:unnamed protein product [Ilex paraguariensis]|uniref:Gamma-tubulin complex component n=1 Tax=Ilex paraguariensis TaxID=185542 RepID=A0ABC8T6M1_9AQUA